MAGAMEVLSMLEKYPITRETLEVSALARSMVSVTSCSELEAVLEWLGFSTADRVSSEANSGRRKLFLGVFAFWVYSA